MYPNPTNGLVQVEYDYKLLGKPTNIVVYDVNGIVLINQPIESNSAIEIDISNLSNGEYFVVLFNKRVFSKAKKILKQ